MKKILTSIIVCFVAIAVSAQQKAVIEVSYSEISFYENGVERGNKYHLLANAGQSKFFNPRSEEIDSLTSTPEGLANFKKTQEAAFQAMIAQGAIDVTKLPRKKETLYVVKSAADSTITVYDVIGTDEPVYYTEPFSEMVWEIGDSTKTILDYECIQAETDYHGRHWTAWFSPEVPMPYGPWKLHGLPGLIFKAGAEGGFLFEATGIEATDRLITPMYKQDDYSKVDRLKALDDHEYYNNNTESMLNARFGGKVKIQKTYDENGKEVEDPKYDGRTLSLEPDYKKDK